MIHMQVHSTKNSKHIKKNNLAKSNSKLHFNANLLTFMLCIFVDTMDKLILKQSYRTALLIVFTHW